MGQLNSRQIKIGSAAPNFDLPSTSDKNFSLSSFEDKVGLVIIFTCNHCPYAKAAWPILINLASEFESKNIAFVGINPNDEHQYPEDSMKVMKQKIEKWHINFPYLRDEEQNVAKEYGAVCTPDIFVYDKNQKLYYHGRINNTWPPVKKIADEWQINKPDKNTKEELKEALVDLLSESPPPKNQKPSMGCSIKWK